MIYLAVLLKSIFTGFAMCLPIGPISIFVIRKTIRYNKRIAFIPCLGSVTADLFYGTITGFGISAMANFFNTYNLHFKLAAAAFLLFLAIHTLKKSPESLKVKKNDKKSILKSFLLGFFLAIINPATLFIMTAILAAIGLQVQANNPMFSFNIIAGLFIGELLWWAFLINITHIAKGHLGKNAPITINTVSGLFLLFLSVFIIIKSTLF